MFSKNRPGCFALRPLCAAGGKIGASALERFQDERLVRLDNSSQRLGLVQGGRAEKPVTPAERRAGMDIAALGGLRHAGSLDHRLGVIEPALLFAQSRHRRLGQGVEGAPAAFAAIARHSVRPAPGDDVRPPQWGQPRRSTLPWPTAPSVGVGVVLAMVGDPIEHRALHRQRTEYRERPLEPRIRPKRAMREQSVKADRDPQPGEDVQDEHDREVGRVDRSVPEQQDRGEHSRERDHHA